MLPSSSKNKLYSHISDMCMGFKTQYSLFALGVCVLMLLWRHTETHFMPGSANRAEWLGAVPWSIIFLSSFFFLSRFTENSLSHSLTSDN